MSMVIKNGTVVTADRSYKADVLIEGDKIAAIGDNLSGDKVVDADGAMIMPGGIDPHTHLEMPFMGTTTAETWESGDVIASLQQKYLSEGLSGPEAHAYSRPPEVEGEATNRAIMLADAAGVPVYIVHTSCEQAHEAIRRARQKGMRVYGEPLMQHLLLDESEYQNKDWLHSAQRVMSPPFRHKSHQDSVGRFAGRFAAGDRHSDRQRDRQRVRSGLRGLI